MAAVAVPRFVATRTDAQVATARSDMAASMKAIVAKIFADNIDATIGRAPDPNLPVRSQTLTDTQGGMTWGEWIIEISGLDGSRWSTGGGTGAGIKADVSAVGATDPENTVQPIGNVKDTAAGGATKKGGCGGVLGIQKNGGFMVFAPNNIGGTNQGDFCYLFKESYKSSGGNGNRIVPLASSGTVEF